MYAVLVGVGGGPLVLRAIAMERPNAHIAFLAHLAYRKQYYTLGGEYERYKVAIEKQILCIKHYNYGTISAVIIHKHDFYHSDFNFTRSERPPFFFFTSMWDHTDSYHVGSRYIALHQGEETLCKYDARFFFKDLANLDILIALEWMYGFLLKNNKHLGDVKLPAFNDKIKLLMQRVTEAKLKFNSAKKITFFDYK